MIRAILFDLDRTLLDRDRSFRDFAETQYDLFTALAAIPREIFLTRLIALDDRGRVWKDEVYRLLVAEFHLETVSGEELFIDFLARMPDYYVPFAGLDEMLDRLKTEGFRLGLITNGRTDWQRRTIHSLGIEKVFDVILISEAEGVRKPEAGIFHRAVRRLDCEPGECVYVGDHPDTDIRGAHEAGLRAIWKRNNDFSGAPDADAVIDELEELHQAIADLKKRAG